MVRESMAYRRKVLQDRFPSWERKTLSQRFDQLAEEFAAREFIVTEGKIYTYGETKEQIDKIAKGLIKLGIKPREHVVVSLGNYPEFIFLTFALAKIGAVKVAVNCRLGLEELAYVVKQADAVCLIISEDHSKQQPGQIIAEVCPEFLDQQVSENYPCLRQIIVRGEGDFKANQRIIPFKEICENHIWISEQELLERQEQTGFPDEIADIFYTSGTTGKPKGAMLSHDMLWRSAYGSCINRAFEEGRRIFIPIPFFHVYGYVEGILASCFVGGTLIPQMKFNAQEALEIMEKHKANDILCVPAIAISLLNQCKTEAYNLESLRAVYCSADPTPLWVWEDIKNKWHVKEINTGYGMTEVCGATVQNDPLDGLDIVATKVGKILPGGSSGLPEYGYKHTQYKTVNPLTGEDSPSGQEGELVCRGNIVTRGYYKEPLITAHSIDKDGWLKTGDIGKIDENGYITLTGRCKDMYKVGGENVSPKKIEQTIESCAKVAQAVAIGIPDSKMGEIGVAFIQVNKGHKCSEEEIRSLCESKLCKFEIPRHYVFIEEKDWPLTATRKIQKTKLKDRAMRELNQKKGR